jgi:hypothetical protein
VRLWRSRRVGLRRPLVPRVSAHHGDPQGSGGHEQPAGTTPDLEQIATGRYIAYLLSVVARWFSKGVPFIAMPKAARAVEHHKLIEVTLVTVYREIVSGLLFGSVCVDLDHSCRHLRRLWS